MKKILVLTILAALLNSCTKSNYKQTALEYLKTKVVNPASVDTLKFFKPDSIFTTFYDTNEYWKLKHAQDSLVDENNMKEAAKVSSVLEAKLKAYHKPIVGWDVRLVYRAKDKKGMIKTDTCRFTFNSNLYTVKEVYGVDL